MTVAELLEYYSNLLIIQYNNKEKAIETIKAFVNVLIANNLAFSIRDCFNIDTAVGQQLDWIGKYVGLDRYYLNNTITGIHFGFSDYAQTEPTDVEGFADVSDFLTKDGDILSYQDIFSAKNKVTDEYFRILLKLKIIINTSNFSNYEIDTALYNFFGSGIFVVDCFNMMECIFVSEESELLNIVYNKGLIPKPMGVGIQGILLDTIYFAFTNENSYYDSNMEGFASASDFATKNGTFLSESDFITV